MADSDSGTLSFESKLGNIPCLIEYYADDGFITPARCVVGNSGASLLDDASHFSATQLKLWQRQAEAHHARITFAPHPTDPDVFDHPGRSATRALASYYAA